MKISRKSIVKYWRVAREAQSKGTSLQVLRMHHTPPGTRRPTVWFSSREAGPPGEETFSFPSLVFFTLQVTPKEPIMHLFFIKLAKSGMSVIIYTIHNIDEYIYMLHTIFHLP